MGIKEHFDGGAKKDGCIFVSQEYLAGTTDEDKNSHPKDIQQSTIPSLEILSTHQLRSILWASRAMWIKVPTKMDTYS
jgi:hypothetical protein